MAHTLYNVKKKIARIRSQDYLNPKFIFNLSLVAENFYSKKNYKKSKVILENEKMDLFSEVS